MMGILLTAVLCAVAGALVMVTRALLATRTQAAALAQRLADLEAEVSGLAGARGSSAAPAAPRGPGTDAPHPASAAPEYVITHLGEDGASLDGADRAPVKVTLSGPAFADAVVRETVVQTASMVHGIRRALAPETRNRIRFEMKREVKRSRKDRKAEMKEALRQYRARQRTQVGAEAATTLPDEGAA